MVIWLRQKKQSLSNDRRRLLSQYDLKEVQAQIGSQIDKEREKVALGERVAETLKSKGWVEVIGPLIDKSIKEIIGGKFDGKWFTSKVMNAKSDDSVRYYVGKAEGLIELSKRIDTYVDYIVRGKKVVERLTKEREQPFARPYEPEE